MKEKDFFLDLVSNLEMKTDFDKFPLDVFFFKEKKYIFELSFCDDLDLKKYFIYNRFNHIDFSKNIFNCNKTSFVFSNLIKIKFKRIYNLSYNDFYFFFREAVKIKIKIENFKMCESSRRYRLFIEEHFKKTN